MTIIQSLGSLATLDTGWLPSVSYGSARYVDGLTSDYAAIYRTQPAIRTCVEFISRNIAQVGLHTFRRISDTDRERVTDHPLPRLLSSPNPYTTTYRLIEALVSDTGIWGEAFWLKVRSKGQIALLRIPPMFMTVKGALVQSEYIVQVGGQRKSFKPEDIVHFRNYNPDSPTRGLSPIETLRLLLAEDFAAAQSREQFWRTGARLGGILKRPADTPAWSPGAREAFAAEWAAVYGGASNAGKTVILEEGMEWQNVTANAKDSQYIDSRKLTREEAARAYHIPPPMVGILDHATFSNVTEQHKNLYQDTLGPWCSMIEQEIELQLLPEFDDAGSMYVEFNLAEKLKGSFEEQAKAMSMATGGPWMTRNEARARLNLPRLDTPEADELITPLNVITGGQANPLDSDPPPKMFERTDQRLLTGGAE